MKKIYIKQLLTAILLLCSTVASAEDVLIDGINYYIDTNSNTATVITGSEKNTGDIDIPAEIVYNGTTCSVTAVGSSAFYECRDITSITIPNSVTSIEHSAFSHCSGLTNITIPDNVASIGDYAFYECTGLASITISKSVTTIGHWAFNSCRGLKSITVNSGNTVYDSRNNCNAIIKTATNKLIQGCNNSVIPNSVTSIEEYAFSRCESLSSIEIPNSVTTIGGYAFQCCYGLASITIPNSITTIENDVLAYCTSLKNITIPNSVTTIKSAAFWGCESLTSIEIPNSVTIIGSEVFHLCKSLKSITIPNSVTSIGGGLFYKCTDLASITVENGNTVYDSRENCNAIIETQTNTLIAGCKRTIIPSDITKINDNAFWHCTGLTSIKIPGSVTAIGNYAFCGCTNLTDVYCFATTVPSTSSDAFDYPNCKTATLHVPATAIESYRATAPWSNFGTIVAIEGSEEDGDEPSITTGKAIDLGLPSGIKWASCNIGATAPEEYGGYYAWGETEEKNYYDWSTYKWCNGTKYSMTKYCTNSNYGTVDNKTTLDPEDDVAQVKWGGNWRMPTLTEQQELIDNCVWVWTTINDVIGYNVTGPNGNSIFLPVAGFRSQKATKTQGSAAHYWTGSLNDDNSSAFTFYFYNKGHRCISNYRDRGHTVRPVYDDGSSTSIEIITPEVNNENTIYDLRGQKLTEITAPGIYIVNGKKVIVK